jgi:hypothetical protein
MFNSKAKLQSAVEEGRKNFIAAFQEWHKKIADKQTELESSFSMEAITSFSVNVWDDYDESEGTYAYVEMRGVPDSVCCDVLIHILEFAKSNKNIVATGAKFGLRFYDSAAVYPTLIGNPEVEFSLFKRWEMTIIDADYETLGVIVAEFKALPQFQGKPITIYSES